MAAGYALANSVGKDGGSDNSKTITRFDVWAPNDQPFNGPGGAGYKLQGSTDNFSSSIVDLASGTTPAGIGGSFSVTSGIVTTTAYRYHRLILNGNGVNNIRVAELRLHEGGGVAGNMTLVTAARAADSAVPSARVLVEYDNAAAPALNTI